MNERYRELAAHLLMKINDHRIRLCEHEEILNVDSGFLDVDLDEFIQVATGQRREDCADEYYFNQFYDMRGEGIEEHRRLIDAMINNTEIGQEER